MATANTTTTGKSAQTTTTGRKAHTLKLSESASYAMAKQIPDIAGRGCIVGTSYGPIDIPPGRLADALAKFLTTQISRGALQ